MATERQCAANKENSKKSTGPQTSAGKAKSCLNHLSHGFASNTAQLIDGEDPEEFKALLADLMTEYLPATPTEQILVERMAQNQWLSGRAFRLQCDVLTMRIHRKVTIPHDLGLFLRYQTTADRAFHKAHTELVKTQKQREKSEIGFEPQTVAQPPEAPAEQAQSACAAAQSPDSPAEPSAPTFTAGQSGVEIMPEAPECGEVFLKNAA